jgi:tetratricopeptide (TPR) repeat protein
MLKLLLSILALLCVQTLIAQQQIRVELSKIENEGKLIEVHVLQAQNKYESSVDLLNNLTKENPTISVFHYELAKAFETLEEKDKAMSAIEKALDLSEEPWYLNYAAYLYNKYEEIDKELETLLRLSQLEPSQIRHYLKAAGCYVLTGKIDAAIKHLDNFQIHNGTSVNIVQEKFLIYKSAEEWEKAYEMLLEWTQIAPSSLAAWESLAALSHDLGKTKDAIKAYQKILKLHPKHLEAQQYLLTQGANQGSIEDENWYTQSDVNIDLKIGKILNELDKNQDDLSLLINRAIQVYKVHSNDPKALTLLADLYYLDNQNNQALPLYIEVLNKVKNKFNIWENALDAALLSGNYRELSNLSEEALLYFPSMYPTFYYYALALMNQKKYEDAIRTLEEGALMVQKQDQLFITNRSLVTICEYQLEDELAANDNLNQLVKDYPNSELVKATRNYINREHIDISDKIEIQNLHPLTALAMMHKSMEQGQQDFFLKLKDNTSWWEPYTHDMLLLYSQWLKSHGNMELSGQILKELKNKGSLHPSVVN